MQAQAAAVADPTRVEMTGHYSLVYSPDDDARTGKGFYVDLWWFGDKSPFKYSPLFKSAAGARAWARRKGGTHEHFTP
jgi:hypothetical protein